MLKEFRNFALKGNFVDIAVGMLLGAGLNPVAKSFIDDIVMPPLGLVLGRVDFSKNYIVIMEGMAPGPYASMSAATEAGAIVIRYGAFISALLSFLVLAFSAFLMVKGYNRVRARLESPTMASPKEVTTKTCPACLSIIPLKAQKCAFCTSELIEE